MAQLLLINPGTRRKPKKRTRKATTKRAPAANRSKVRKSVSKKNKRRSSATIQRGAIMPKRKKIIRRNPSRARKVSTRLLGGLNPKKAVMDAVIGQPGILFAQLFAKKFGKDGRSWFEAGWTWENFMWATLGSFAAGIAGNVIAPGKGAKMLEHGLSATLNKLIQDKGISRSDTLKSALGQYNAARYGNLRQLNPTAAQSMQQFDMYGNRTVNPNMSGQILPVSQTMGATPVRPDGNLNGRFTTRTDLGSKPIPWANAFFRN